MTWWKILFTAWLSCGVTTLVIWKLTQRPNVVVDDIDSWAVGMALVTGPFGLVLELKEQYARRRHTRAT